MPDSLGTLLVSCPDRRGIVASLAQVLYGHGANILDSDQHSDREAGQFFQRLRFDTSELNTDRVALEHGIREVADRFEMTWRLTYDGAPKRVAIFVSKLDHCFFDILLRHRAGELDCELALVISNHPDLEEAANRFGLPYHLIPITKESKTEQEGRTDSLNS